MTKLTVPLLDLTRQYQTIKPEIGQAISQVLQSGRFILGPEVDAFEQEIAAYCGVKHAVGVASGTDALMLSLRALEVGSGDVVLTTAFTFGATASAICNVGARPVFIDIDPKTYNVDPEALGALLERDGQTRAHAKAIIPVHLYGQMANMAAVTEIAEQYDLVVVEDAAQAIGATYKGQKAGTFGNIGCFSFFPSKNLGAYGDGGLVVTDDEALAEKLRLLRVHGARPKYYHRFIGYNSRLDALQAAVLRVKLKYLDEWSQARREKAERYDALLDGVGNITTPFVAQDCTPIYHQYTIRVLGGHRDALASHLKAQGIGTGIYYPLPLHLQKCFLHLKYRDGDLPNAEQASREVLSLPVYPELIEEQLRFVAEEIRGFMA